MKKYKLLKWYPCLSKEIKVGDEAEFSLSESYYYTVKSAKGFTIPASHVENNPEFWEEVKEYKLRHKKTGLYLDIDKYNIERVRPYSIFYGCKESDFERVCKEEVKEKDYEILSLSFKRSERPEIRSVQGYNDDYIETLLKCDNTIHSVKRLSTGEIFTVEDKVNFVHSGNTKYFTISGFTIHNNDEIRFVFKEIQGLEFPFYCMTDLKHYKEPILITEDGKELFVGDEYAYVLSNFTVCSGRILTENFGKSEFIKYFSNWELASGYAEDNKPRFSRKELREELSDFFRAYPVSSQHTIEKLGL